MNQLTINSSEYYGQHHPNFDDVLNMFYQNIEAKADRVH